MMARLAIYGALLAHLQPALASFYTVSSYFVVTPTPSVYPSDCSDDCRTLTYTRTVTVDPTVTPTAKPFSSTTRTYSYDDLEVVSLYLSAGALVDAGRGRGGGHVGGDLVRDPDAALGFWRGAGAVSFVVMVGLDGEGGGGGSGGDGEGLSLTYQQ
jgi:hypothetical protein